MTGGSAETHLIVVYFFYSPLKNMVGQKFGRRPWFLCCENIIVSVFQFQLAMFVSGAKILTHYSN
jgi:hypothetical protein